MDAIIVAGGKGSRMNAPIPKALVEIQGMSLVKRQIRYLRDNGVAKIVVAAGFMGEQLQEHLADEEVEIVLEETPLGTGGAIRNCMQHVHSGRVLVLNCDDLTDIPVKELESRTENILCVAHPRSNFGVVEEKDGYAVFREKPFLDIWVSCGWYCFNREEIFPELPERGSIEYDVFPRIKLRLYKHEGYWGTTNTPKHVQERNEDALPDTLQF